MFHEVNSANPVSLSDRLEAFVCATPGADIALPRVVVVVVVEVTVGVAMLTGAGSVELDWKPEKSANPSPPPPPPTPLQSPQLSDDVLGLLSPTSDPFLSCSGPAPVTTLLWAGDLLKAVAEPEDDDETMSAEGERDESSIAGRGGGRDIGSTEVLIVKSVNPSSLVEESANGGSGSEEFVSGGGREESVNGGGRGESASGGGRGESADKASSSGRGGSNTSLGGDSEVGKVVLAASEGDREKSSKSSGKGGISNTFPPISWNSDAPAPPVPTDRTRNKGACLKNRALFAAYWLSSSSYVNVNIIKTSLPVC